MSIRTYAPVPLRTLLVVELFLECGQQDGARLSANSLVFLLWFNNKDTVQVLHIYSLVELWFLTSDLLIQPSQHCAVVVVCGEWTLRVQPLSAEQPSLIHYWELDEIGDYADCVAVKGLYQRFGYSENMQATVMVIVLNGFFTSEEQGDQGVSCDVQQTCAQLVMLRKQ